MWDDERTFAVSLPVAGMETTAEERERWYDMDRVVPATRDVVRALCRDIDRQSAEIARLTAELAKALAECRSWEGAAHEYEEQGRFALAEIARITAELAKTQTIIEASPAVQKAMGRFHTKLNESYKAERDQARADVAKAREECAKILDGMAAAEGALFLGATQRGDHIRSIMFNSAANAYRAGAAVIRARSTESETPEPARPPFPREWDDPK